MRLLTRFGLILALLAAPLRAATVRVEPLDAAPAPVAPSAVAPVYAAALSVSPLTAAPLAAAPLAASPAALPAAVLPAAAAVPAAAVPAPAAAAVRSRARSAAADGPKSRSAAAPTAEGADAPDAGRALFDRSADARPLSEIVKENSSRPLRGVFIQQEHEGSLLAPDARDSSGNVFKYYRPVEMRPNLAAEVDGGLTGYSKLAYSVRKAFQFRGRGTPEAAWRAWPPTAKVQYLAKLEDALTAERGPQAAWDGKVSLILERLADAPDFLTKNPHMEPPPDGLRGYAGARYLQPEIVTSKDHPASSVSEALGRAKMIIADTGHAGVQFHVFMKAAPKDLLAQMDSLDGALQLVNDVLFAEAAAGSDLNITHASLRPWHSGRSRRVRELLEAQAEAPHVPAAEDDDSEKHAFVGFRYWGMENGKAVVSLELRGASLPWKREGASRMVQGVDNPSLPKRDYAAARAYLTFLALYAESVARGEAPRVPVKPVVIDEAAADAAMRARAAELGVPDSAFDGLGALARRLTGAGKAPDGYLFPFAASAADAPELRAFEAEAVLLAARMKVAEESGQEDQRAHARFLFWSAYKEWAQRFAARQNARLADLVRAVSR
jgi:hypothetical protein